MSNKPTCVLCHVPLSKLDNDDYLWICAKDRAHKYQIYAEVMSYDNNFSTTFSEEEENQIELAGLEGVGDPVLMTSNNEDNLMKPKSVLNENTIKSDIKIPDYMKSRNGVTVEYRES